MSDWQVEIESGRLTVFMIDECHLLWGDMIGYVWRKTNMRIEIPIKNEKERQTYYGAEENRLINCIKFAPNGPEQNPVEDIWLQAKNFVRKYYDLCNSFKMVKWLFEFFTNGQIFDFPKIYEYDFLPQPI